MSRNHLLTLAAVAAVAYVVGYYQAQRATTLANTTSTAALTSGTEWLNWQAGP